MGVPAGAAGHHGQRLLRGGLLFPLLPGDSLLFTGGLLAAQPHPPVNIWVLVTTVPIGAVPGDTAYFIGRWIGTALFEKEDSQFFKNRYVTSRTSSAKSTGPRPAASCRSCGRSLPVIAGVSKMRYTAPSRPPQATSTLLAERDGLNS